MAVATTREGVCVKKHCYPPKATSLHRHARKALWPPFLGVCTQPTCIKINISNGLKGRRDTDTMTTVLILGSPNNIERGNGSNALEIFKDIVISLKRQMLKSRPSKTINPSDTLLNMKALTRSQPLWKSRKFCFTWWFFSPPQIRCPNWLFTIKLAFLVSLSIFLFFILPRSVFLSHMLLYHEN